MKAENTFNKLSGVMSSLWKETLNIGKTAPKLMESGKGAFNASLAVKKSRSALAPTAKALEAKQTELASMLENLRAAKGGGGYERGATAFWKSQADTVGKEVSSLKKQVGHSKRNITMATKASDKASEAFKQNLTSFAKASVIPGTVGIGTLGAVNLGSSKQPEYQYQYPYPQNQ